MEQTTTIVKGNDKYDMENESKWKVTFKTKEVELKVKMLSKKFQGILNSLEKLKGNFKRKKFYDDFYFIGNGRHRMIYLIKSNQTIQIIDIVHKSFLWKNIKIQAYTIKN